MRHKIHKVQQYTKKRLTEIPNPTPPPEIRNNRKKTFKELKSLFLNYVNNQPENK